MLYKLLSRCHGEYKTRIWAELDDLYEGGYKLYEHARRYIKPHPGEPSERYNARVECAAYINHLGPIINLFVSNLFGQELTITQGADAKDTSTPGKAPVDPDFYTAFGHDADLKGTTFAEVLKTSLTTALLKGKTLIGVDLPESMTLGERAAIVTRADEDKLDLARAYCFEIPVEQLIDWEYDEQGNFKWAVLHRIIENRDTPEARDDMVVEEFKIWRKLTRTDEGQDLAEPLIIWQTYRTPPRKPDEETKPDLDIPLLNSGDTTFRWIPLVELLLPKALWVGNMIGCMAREHYSRRASLVSGEQDALHAIPYVKQGPEVGGVGEAIPSEVQQNPHRGEGVPHRMAVKGFVVLGAQDDIGFAEPSGAAFEIVDKQLDGLVDAMYRVSHQMAASISNTTTSLGRSGKSKEEDRHATEVVLGELGNKTRKFGSKVYETVSAARKDKTIWSPHGLDKYDMQDRETILEEATSEPLINTGSKTFKKIYRTKIAMALIGDIPPEQQDTIRKEIEDGVDHEEEVARIQEENPVPVTPVPTPKVGKPKVPQTGKPAVPPVAKPGKKSPNAR